MTRRNGLLAVAGIFLFLLAFIPAAPADLASGTITHVYFLKDGQPYNGSVRYTVSCYGSRDRNYVPAGSAPEQDIGTPVAGYRYSASCDHYGCTIYEPYYTINSGGTTWFIPDRCDVEGDAGGVHFVISNFSDRPYTTCTGLQDQYPWLGNDPEPNSSYFQTAEYDACQRTYRNRSVNTTHFVYASCDPARDSGCFSEMLPGGIPLRRESMFTKTMNGTDMDLKHYLQYLETCDPSADPDCPGDIVNNRPLKTLYEYRPFLNDSSRLYDPCMTFFILANRSLVLPREIEDASPHTLIDNKVRDICESRWMIPPDNQTSSPSPEPVNPVPAVPRKPVESLYCSIVQFFGMRCD